MNKKTLVTGAGGFIGHHLVNYLKERGYWVRGVDLKKPEFSELTTEQLIDIAFEDRIIRDVNHEAVKRNWLGQ